MRAPGLLDAAVGPTSPPSPRALVDRIRCPDRAGLYLSRVPVGGEGGVEPGGTCLADELAAFANGDGGLAVLGVDRATGEVSGVPMDRLDALERWVSWICNDLVKPSLDADIRKLELPDSAGHLTAVVRVEIGRSLFVHRSPGGYFRRIGSSKREMPPEVLARLFQERRPMDDGADDRGQRSHEEGLTAGETMALEQ